jgi:hypothetical protein
MGVALTLPSLRAGFFADDLVHLGTFAGLLPAAFSGTPFQLFRFSVGDVAKNTALMRAGLLPWWTDPHLKLAFFRPLTALIHALDYRLWGMRPLGYHVTNLILWAAVLFTAGELIRRLAPTPRAATLAFLVYAFADARALVVTWIANRNALIATALAFATVIAWDSYRRGSGRLRAVLACSLFVLALLSGESAIGGLALLAGYEVFAVYPSLSSLGSRAKGLAPFVAIALLYVVAYKIGGFGASGSGMYVDPTGDPLGWMLVATQRYPALLAALIWGWPIDVWINGGVQRDVILIGSLVLAPVTVAVFWGTVRRHRSIAAICLGAGLALVPLTATFPSSRLLLLPGIGGALLVGTYLDEAWPAKSGERPRTVFAAVLALRHVVIAPITLLVTVGFISNAFQATRQEILDSPWPRDLADRDLLLVDAPHWASAFFLSAYLGMEARPYPHSAHVLNLSPFPATLTRVSPVALELRLKCGEMLTTEFERLMRGSRLRKGYEADAGLFRAVVLEMGVQGPTAVRFDFLKGLGPRSSLARWSGERYEIFDVPPLGWSVDLPAISQGFGRLRTAAPVCSRNR